MSILFVYWVLFSLHAEFLSKDTFTVVFAENAPGRVAIHPNDSVSKHSVDGTSDLNNLTDNNATQVNSSVNLNSSFIEIPHSQTKNSVKPNEFVFAEVVSQNSGVVNSIAEERDAVFTLVDTTIELEKRVNNIPKHATSHNETPATVVKNITEDEKVTLNTSETISDNEIEKDSTDSREEKDSEKNVTEKTENLVVELGPKENLTEEIPSFSEWTQKQLEQAEKNKEQVNSSVQSPQTNGKSIKKRSKNYASPDCGAKIVAANPEAISPGSVLSSLRDEYKLNTCTSRIWFVVELCEAIQAKKIDLANFELFSSSPKDFSIYVSDRFPTRDWSNVGHFTAKDERDIQTFDLHPHLFGKYIKFEMHSHHGSEHYCPISLFRVYGTSEFEVLETEDQPQSNNLYDEEDDEVLDFDKEDVPRNLLSSATDAVISIVKKAAEVLGNKRNDSNQTVDLQANDNVKYLSSDQKCFTPTHLLVCNNCSDNFYSSVYDLLSCQSKFLHTMINITTLRDALLISNICSDYGLNFYRNVTTNATFPFLSFLPPKYIAALCNTLAVLENKVVRNSTVHCFNCTKTLSKSEGDKLLNQNVPKTLESDLGPVKVKEINKTTPSSKDTEVKKGGNGVKEIDNKTEVVDDKKQEQDVASTDSNGSQKELPKNDVKLEKDIGGSDNSSEIDSSSLSNENLEEPFENYSAEGMDNQTGTTGAPPTSMPPVVPQAQNKESVFVRLTNRIKALERNMSLSSQYLEELSKRYKKQVEEMQRLLDKTITTLNEESKKKEERTQKLEEQLANLTAAIESLTAERNMWMTFLYWLMLVASVFALFWFFCGRGPTAKQPTVRTREKNNEVQRRKSDDILIKKSATNKKRRPSEEALNIQTHTYQHLLLDDDTYCKKKEKKRKRKKPNLVRSRSIIALTEETTDDDYKCRVIPFVNDKLPPECKRQTSAPAKYEPDDIPNKIQDVPFVLDESEHTAMDPLVFNNFEIGSKPRESNMKSEYKLNEVKFLLGQTRSEKDVRNNINLIGNGKSYHKKSASVDDTGNKSKLREFIQDRNSFNGSEDAKFSLNRREKKGALKKIFKSFSFKQKVEESQNC